MWGRPVADPIDLGMFRPTAALAMLACACVLIVPATAIAQDPAAQVPDIALSEAQPVTTGPSYGIARASSTPPLWATVNICDTATSPDSMGVRAGMPGKASGQRMFMRFRAEYWSRASRTGPPEGVTFTMRGTVLFEWRKRGRTLRSVSRTTETGIRGVDGGYPAGTSKAMCLIY